MKLLSLVVTKHFRGSSRVPSPWQTSTAVRAGALLTRKNSLPHSCKSDGFSGLVSSTTYNWASLFLLKLISSGHNFGSVSEYDVRLKTGSSGLSSVFITDWPATVGEGVGDGVGLAVCGAG